MTQAPVKIDSTEVVNPHVGVVRDNHGHLRNQHGELCDENGNKLRALRVVEDVKTDSLQSGLFRFHVVFLPNAHYWPHVLHDASMWSDNAAREIADGDEIIFWIGKSRRIRCFVVENVPGKKINLAIETDTHIGGQEVVKPEKRGEFYAIDSCTHERWWVVNPAGQIVQRNLLNKSAAEFEAAKRNAAHSPSMGLAGAR
jgi:hypothetical protein